MIITRDDLLARDLAVAAGQRLLALRASASDQDAGAAGPDRLRRDGDRLSHEFLAAELARERPGDALLSEEGADDDTRLSASRVWIVDPLDGTREFGEPGRSDWAVHVALWERGELTAGAVALPAQGRVLSTAEPPAAPGQAAPGQAAPGQAAPGQDSPGPGLPGQAGGQPLRLLVSRSRPPEFVRQLAELLGAELLPLGSAGAKAAVVITGEADAYVHAGGQYEWDSAAPVAVARAAGLHTSRIDGSALHYNQTIPAIPDILISPAGLAPLLLQAISAVSPAAAQSPASTARLPVSAQYPEPG